MPENRYALAGNVALVTGGSRGIGRAVATRLGRAGASVAVNYRHDADHARTAVEEIGACGSYALAVQADVSDAKAVERMLDQVEAALGPVDILVNNAGVLRRTPFLEISIDEWEWIMGTNLRGCFLVAQATARRMVAHGMKGCIVNVSSSSARVATPSLAHYAASKGGITMLTRAMAFELAGYGIRVNEVNPGLIETDLNRADVRNPEWLARRLGRIPLRRTGTPEDVAGAVLFLASHDAALMTGASIAIDGGSTVT
ncbi:MAG TPA: 3-oxoacyl-ACP reductase family protein [bacterium]|nr:3-oxoacyl-ACP reductase family protein [bacterium]